METAAIHTILHLATIFSQHVQMAYLKNQYAENQICLIASFTIALRKDEVKVSHKKLTAFFHNKNASTKPLNYPINLVFVVKNNLVYS